MRDMSESVPEVFRAVVTEIWAGDDGPRTVVSYVGPYTTAAVAKTSASRLKRNGESRRRWTSGRWQALSVVEVRIERAVVVWEAVE